MPLSYVITTAFGYKTLCDAIGAFLPPPPPENASLMGGIEVCFGITSVFKYKCTIYYAVALVVISQKLCSYSGRSYRVNITLRDELFGISHSYTTGI